MWLNIDHICQNDQKRCWFVVWVGLNWIGAFSKLCQHVSFIVLIGCRHWSEFFAIHMLLGVLDLHVTYISKWLVICYGGKVIVQGVACHVWLSYPRWMSYSRLIWHDVSEEDRSLLCKVSNRKPAVPVQTQDIKLWIAGIMKLNPDGVKTHSLYSLHLC